MAEQSLESKVKEQLKEITYPGIDRDIVSLGFINNISVNGERVEIIFAPTTKKQEHIQQLISKIEQQAQKVEGISEVTVELEEPDAGGQKKKQQTVEPEPVDNVEEVIAVASGKGGVGKSTVAVNLASSLACREYRVGFADLDFYGPSAPTVFGMEKRPEVTADEQIIPLDYRGIQVISIGFVLPSDQATIWRGPMVSQGVEQLLGGVAWDNLDYLILDLPPGTGDTQITLAQKIKMNGAILVTTPQQIAVADVRRANQMFNKMDVETLGIIENMSNYICPECGAKRQIFGSGGGEQLAEELNVPFLGGIPLGENIREATDRGTPIVFDEPDSEATKSFGSIAEKISK